MCMFSLFNESRSPNGAFSILTAIFDCAIILDMVHMTSPGRSVRLKSFGTRSLLHPGGMHIAVWRHDFRAQQPGAFSEDTVSLGHKPSIKNGDWRGQQLLTAGAWSTVQWACHTYPV